MVILPPESTIVVAMSMQVHGGSPRAMHKSNACVGQMGEVSSQKFIYTSHQQLLFGGPCANCKLSAKAWKSLNGLKEKPPIVSAISFNLLPTPCITYSLNERVGYSLRSWQAPLLLRCIQTLLFWRVCVGCLIAHALLRHGQSCVTWGGGLVVDIFRGLCLSSLLSLFHGLIHFLGAFFFLFFFETQVHSHCCNVLRRPAKYTLCNPHPRGSG